MSGVFRLNRTGGQVRRINSGLQVGVTISYTNFFNRLYSGTRNDYGGTVGFQFQPTEDLTVVALGRAISTSMSQNHYVGVWRTADQVLMASVTVTPSSPVDGIGYVYETLDSSVTLVSGTYYRIGSQEFSGGDLWSTKAIMSDHKTIADILGHVWTTDSPGYPVSYFGVNDSAFVPPTFFI